MARPTEAVVALDQGTTSSRAVVFGRDGAILGLAQREFPQHYPHPGWVEHDPEELWESQVAVFRDALTMAELQAGDVVAIGVANQRETVVLWDAESGETLGNAIVWQCRRTADLCEDLRRAGHEPLVRERTGLRLDPYFSATKLQWLLGAHPEAQALLAKGRLRAGTIDSFLVWRLTGGRCHVTDYSNASRTMLFNLRTLDWDDDLLGLFGVPRSILPRVVASSGVAGRLDASWLGLEVPIAGIAGDQQAALFGQACFDRGDAKNTYGTGCFLLMNVGGEPVASQHGLLSTIAWGLGSAAGQTAAGAPTTAGIAGAAASGSARAGVRYALEGSVFIGGAAVQWLRDGLGLIAEAGEVGPLAAQVPDNGGVYFVPAFTGLGAPFWDPGARGLLVGITRGTTRAHIARATEEAICYQTRAVLDAMTEDAGFPLAGLKADGGATGDDLLLQLQADLLGIPVERRGMKEATAFGAAALAGLAVGLWSLDDIRRLAGSNTAFEPRMAKEEGDRLYGEWRRAAERALAWA
jgi:glycerol kinase